MLIEVVIKKGNKKVKKQVKLTESSIMQILKVSVAGQIFEQVGEGPFRDIDGYVVSITDKD